MKPRILQEAIDNGAFFVSESDEKRYYAWRRTEDQWTGLAIVFVGIICFLIGLVAVVP